MKRCDRCDFWIKLKKEDGDADCRRHPPMPFLKVAMNPLTHEQGMVVLSYWPKTRPELQCGEYLRKARVLPFCQRLIAQVLWFCWPVIGRVIGFLSRPLSKGEKCPTKEESKDTSTADSLRRNATQN